MIKKIFIFILFISLVGCASRNPDKDFMNLVFREKAMKDLEPKRIFNPSSAMLISSLPKKLGDFKNNGSINDYETFQNGLGYSIRYTNNKFKNAYWIDFFAYNLGRERISENIYNGDMVNIYKQTRNEILKSNTKIELVDENIISFKSPNGNHLEVRETIFKYYDAVRKTEMISYLYFGSSLNSFYKIRINYNSSLGENAFKAKEDFIKDLGYYYTEGMSLNDFNKYKKSKKENPVAMVRK